MITPFVDADTGTVQTPELIPAAGGHWWEKRKKGKKEVNLGKEFFSDVIKNIYV